MLFSLCLFFVFAQLAPLQSVMTGNEKLIAILTDLKEEEVRACVRACVRTCTFILPAAFLLHRLSRRPSPGIGEFRWIGRSHLGKILHCLVGLNKRKFVSNCPSGQYFGSLACSLARIAPVRTYARRLTNLQITHTPPLNLSLTHSLSHLAVRILRTLTPSVQVRDLKNLDGGWFANLMKARADAAAPKQAGAISHRRHAGKFATSSELEYQRQHFATSCEKYALPMCT